MVYLNGMGAHRAEQGGTCPPPWKIKHTRKLLLKCIFQLDNFFFAPWNNSYGRPCSTVIASLTCNNIVVMTNVDTSVSIHHAKTCAGLSVCRPLQNCMHADQGCNELNESTATPSECCDTICSIQPSHKHRTLAYIENEFKE